MALSGIFTQYPISGKEFGLYCTWTGAQSQSGNYTDITVNTYARCYSLDISAKNGTININGTPEGFNTPKITDYKNNWHNIWLASTTVRVWHNADGTKLNVPLSVSWNYNASYSGKYFGTITASTVVDLDQIAVYTLYTSAGTGSNISVYRTGSGGYGTIGYLSSGSRLYKGDTLKITFAPSSNYAISTHTVNGATFTSGNTHTVSGNVTVAATAQVLASKVGATDAYIGSTSTITVTRYNSAYYHSLHYNLGNKSGYLTASGELSTSEIKFQNTSIAFPLPQSFYEELPNSRTGKCVITCKTYKTANSTSILGSATNCTINVFVSASNEPTVHGAVIDENPITVALTGDSSKLIRYKSKAIATIEATAHNSASIAAKYINDIVPVNDQRVFENVSETYFSFRAEDTRGMKVQKTIHPIIIPYIQLTINPILSRPSPTGNKIELDFSGDVFRGDFGEEENTLTVQYRFKEPDGSFGDWRQIESTKIVYGTQSYCSDGIITLQDDFDYRKEYQFQIKASDGSADTTKSRLSEVVKVLNVAKGIPVFDWGENDFNFNVPVNVNGSISINHTNLDYVVEYGEKYTWTYRKWDSGIAECWRTVYITAQLNEPWGSLYVMENPTGSYSYPFIFVDTPSENVTLTSASNQKNNSYQAWICTSSEHTQTNEATAKYQIARATPITEECSYRIHYYVIGKWK